MSDPFALWDLAECTQTDPEAWYPGPGEHASEAKKVCLRCQVRAECLEYALNHGDLYGIWGGTTEKERRHMNPAHATPVLLPCGTRAAYQRGCRCERCLAAQSEYGKQAIPPTEGRMNDLRRETEIMGCNCLTARYRPHEHGVPGCTGIPVVVTRWVSDWELADEPDA